MSYSQLIQEQRYPINNPLKKEFNQTEIANSIVVHKSTICRQLQRNTVSGVINTNKPKGSGKAPK